MADNTRQDRYNYYTANGSAAFDRNYLTSSAAPELKPRPELPEERITHRKKTVRVKAKASFSPFVVAGLAMVAVMLFMMISAYVRLYETTAEVSELTETLSVLQQEQTTLMSQYESRIDLAHIEAMAASELGMMKPGSDQTVYVNLAGPDQAEVITNDKSEAAHTIWQAFSESVADLLSDLKAYFQ